MIQVDFSNPTMEPMPEGFLDPVTDNTLAAATPGDFDPEIAAEFGGAPESISTLMNNIADFLHVSDNLITMPLMFLFNLLVTWLVVYCIYYRFSHRRDYYVTYMLFSSGMFVLLWLMQILDIQTGFVLGLFAIFGMIRYRTETVPIREMNYMFLIIAISVINSLSLKAEGLAWYLLLFANAVIVLMAWGFEAWQARKRISTKIILYEKIENIKPENRATLIADIEERTGLKVLDVEIGHIDFLRDVAYIKVTYPLEAGKIHNSIDQMVKYKAQS
ncbi:MAG: DUF4956 domain-containing protein [Paludibacteraceae bacterium]|nr:DUF4956 domain-containing protein [Paludibacteraceae bacterium]